MTYFNTTKLHGTELREYQVKAKGQENLVAEWFRNNPTLEATAEDVNTHVLPKAPRHSLSRVMANLTNQGTLEKVDGSHVEGQYGRPIGFWRYRQQDPQQELAL